MVILIENMLSLQTEKSSSGQIFWILEKTSNMGENIYEIDYVVKWSLFQKRQHHFSDFWTVYNFKNPANSLVLLMDIKIS